MCRDRFGSRAHKLVTLVIAFGLVLCQVVHLVNIDKQIPQCNAMSTLFTPELEMGTLQDVAYIKNHHLGESFSGSLYIQGWAV